MKYLFTFLFLMSLSIHAQCGQYAQIKNERLSHVRFWNEQNGFVIGGASLLTTTNGGISWSAHDVRDFQRLTVNPLNEAQILNANKAIIVGDDGIILKTEDQGLTWQRDIVRLGGVFDYKDVHFTNENIGYITGNYFNSANQEQIFLYKTTDGGDTWSEILLTFPSTTTERIVNEIYFINENVGYMSTLGAFSGMFKTTDGGDNWVDIDPEFDGFYTNFHFSNDQIGYAMAGDTVIRTNDGGDSWTELSLISEIGFSFYNNYLYLNESNYGQTRRYNLSSSNIESVEVGIHGLKRDTFFVNNTVGYAVGQKEPSTPSLGRFILKTVDGGNTWTILDGIGTIESGTSGNANNFSKMADNEFIYSYTTSQYGTGSYIFKSSDNAVSWQLIKQYDDVIGETLLVGENYISFIRPSNPDNAADNMIFSESTDGGETWQDITEIDAQILSPFNTNQQISVNEIFSSNFSDLRYSNDKGQTWQTITIPAGYELWDYQFIDDQTGYITLQDFSITKTTFFKTENRGVTWEEIISFTGEDSFPGYNFKVTSGNKLVIYPSQNTGMLYLYENNSVTEKPFDFYTAKFQIINETTFILVNNDFELFISYDNGDNWVQRFFINTDYVIPEIYVESEESIFLWKYNYIEQLKNYYPNPPDVIKGQTSVQVGQSYAYDVPLNLFTYLEWDATDGLITTNINNNAVRATVRWLSPGIHYVRARYVNECGPSEYAELQVNVAPLNIDNDTFLITTTSETCLET
ncbi:MAG: hypothetical protein KJO22_05355, partial [Bacteroidia bacterium]|nr:hypothetical protein [Bacteroidia bacterium]